jgi:hypothetical protein
MDIIYSNFVNMKNSIAGSDNPNMLKFSNYLSQEHGFKTIFYGDKRSIEIFKDIPFNEVHELNDPRIQKMPKELWSISKLFAITQVNRPFIHMDQDFFLFKKFKRSFLEQNIVYFHDEFWVDKKTKNYQSFFKLDPSKIKFKDRSYNCAIIGGKNFNILKNICNEIIDFVVDNNEYITKKLNSKKSKNFDKFMPPVLVEQVWIFKLLKYYKQNFKPFLKTKAFVELSEEGFVKHVCHLQSQKNDVIVKKTLNQINSYLNI